MERGTDSSPILLTRRKADCGVRAGGGEGEDTIPELGWQARGSAWPLEVTPLPPECPGFLNPGALHVLSASPAIELDSDFADELLTHVYERS